MLITRVRRIWRGRIKQSANHSYVFDPISHTHTHTHTHTTNVILSSNVSNCFFLPSPRRSSFKVHCYDALGVIRLSRWCNTAARSAREVERSDTVKFIARVRIYSVYSFRFYPFLLAGWSFFLFFFPVFLRSWGGQHAFSISTPTCRSSPAKRDDDARRDWSTRLTTDTPGYALYHENARRRTLER